MSEEDLMNIYYYLLSIRVSLTYIDAAFTVLILLACVFSWVKIPQWRTFRSYAFMNMVIANIGHWGHQFVGFSNAPLNYLLGVCAIGFYYWVLVLCICVYEDQVQVFRGEVTRKVLKSTLFAWGVPAIFMPMDYALHCVDSRLAILYIPLNTLPLIMDIVIFLRVVTALCRGKTGCQYNIWVATFTFVTSATMMLTDFCTERYGYRILHIIGVHDYLKADVLLMLAFIINSFLIIFIKTLYLLSKPNRVICYDEFYKGKVETDNVPL